MLLSAWRNSGSNGSYRNEELAKEGGGSIYQQMGRRKAARACRSAAALR